MMELLFRLASVTAIAAGAALLGYSVRALQFAADCRPEADEQHFHPAVRSAEPRSAAGQHGMDPSPPPESAGPADRLRQEKRNLVHGLIRAYYLSSTPRAELHIRRVLGSVGVTPIRADEDEQFDPNRHMAVESMPTSRYGAHHRIAELRRVGWHDSQGVLKRADVAVWTSDNAGAAYGGRSHI